MNEIPRKSREAYRARIMYLILPGVLLQTFAS